jgi:predicted lipid-binding transport protein (Tim44 family)
MMNLTSRRGRTVIALAAALTLLGSVAEARVGRSGSFGSRGARTWNAPPATRTAPNEAAPIQRSQVPQNQLQQQRPGVPGAQVAQPRRFGFGTGLMAGLLGAGLLGMLFGNGFFGGLAGIGSFLGLMLQIGLIVLLASLALKWFRRRQEPAYAGQTAQRSAMGGSVPPAGGLGGALGGALGGLGRARVQNAPRRPGVPDEIGIAEKDYADFERTLNEVQSAYSRNDVAALWSLATPEMAGYIQEELNENAGNGVVNTITDVRLLQGDLAEAWREGTTDFATVAMRFSMIDVTKEKATGRVVDGDPTRPVEATELWTFRRDQGGPWKLSAIQQS